MADKPKSRDITEADIAVILRAAVKLEPSNYEWQLSVMSRALCLGAKMCGVPLPCILKEVERDFYQMRVPTASPLVIPTAGEVAALLPPSTKPH